MLSTECHSSPCFLFPVSLSQTLFHTCENPELVFPCLTGGAVCDGREADLHEAPARQPLHAGPGLFQDLFLRAVPLHSLWFWMVMTPSLSFPPRLGPNCNSHFCPQWSVISFITCLQNRRSPFERLIQLYRANSGSQTFLINSRRISLLHFLPLDIHLPLHIIYWITNMTLFIQPNYNREHF